MSSIYRIFKVVFLPFIFVWNFVKGFLYMPLDIYNYVAYLYNLDKLLESQVFKDYDIEISTFGLMYTVLNFRDEFFKLDSLAQQQHIVSELEALFYFLRMNGLPETIINYNQRRLTAKNEVGETFYINSILIYFTFKTYYIKTWRLIVLTLIGIFFLIF